MTTILKTLSSYKKKSKNVHTICFPKHFTAKKFINTLKNRNFTIEINIKESHYHNSKHLKITILANYLYDKTSKQTPII